MSLNLTSEPKCWKTVSHDTLVVALVGRDPVEGEQQYEVIATTSGRTELQPLEKVIKKTC